MHPVEKIRLEQAQLFYLDNTRIRRLSLRVPHRPTLQVCPPTLKGTNATRAAQRIVENHGAPIAYVQDVPIQNKAFQYGIIPKPAANVTLSL